MYRGPWGRSHECYCKATAVRLRNNERTRHSTASRGQVSERRVRVVTKAQADAA